MYWHLEHPFADTPLKMWRHLHNWLVFFPSIVNKCISYGFDFSAYNKMSICIFHFSQLFDSMNVKTCFCMGKFWVEVANNLPSNANYDWLKCQNGTLLLDSTSMAFCHRALVGISIIWWSSDIFEETYENMRLSFNYINSNFERTKAYKKKFNLFSFRYEMRSESCG